MSIDLSKLPQKPVAQQFLIEDTNPLDPRAPLSAWVALHTTTINAIADAVIAKLEAKTSTAPPLPDAVRELILHRLGELENEIGYERYTDAENDEMREERDELRKALGDD